ncbi:MAG: glycosyltransferase family 2 protein [Alphaproteobacteria bacterium]
MKPKVSVIMPIYNGAEFLSKAIDSVLNQTLKDIELLIDTTGSSDGATDIAENYSKKDKRIRHEKNSGSHYIANKLNHLTNLAKAPYIARMDGDDIALPNRLSEQLAFLEKNSNIAALGCHFICIDRDGNNLPQHPFDYPADSEALRQKCDNGLFPIHHPTMMIRTDVLKKIGGYRENITFEDLDLYLRLHRANYLFSNLPVVLLHYRFLPDSTSNNPTTAYIYQLQQKVLYLAHRRIVAGDADPLANMKDQDINFDTIKHLSKDINEVISIYVYLLNFIIKSILRYCITHYPQVADWHNSVKKPDNESNFMLRNEVAYLLEQIINLCPDDDSKTRVIDALAGMQGEFPVMPIYVFNLFFQVYMSFPHLSNKIDSNKKQHIFNMMNQLGLQNEQTELTQKWSSAG